MRRVLLVLVLACASCRGLGAENASARCRDVQDQYRLWGALAVATAAIAGSSALATAVPNDSTPRLAFGLSSAAVTALGATAIYLRDDLVHEYANDCTEVPFPEASTSTVAVR